jgi:formylmethanofuran dehydrogenase subunit B
LADAKYPLIYGLRHATCETQRVALAIADWIGGTVDTPTSRGRGPAGTSFHGVYEVGCTLGEIANRGEFILFWGGDPVQTHPRHLAKYSLFPKGMFLPRGRADRHAVLVDTHRTQTAEVVDEFYSMPANADFEALWILRALVQGKTFDANAAEAATGIALTRWQTLVDRMKSAKFGVICYGAMPAEMRGKHIVADAIQALVRDLNAFTRFVASPLGTSGNAHGADQVVAWQTGYPFGVNLSRGYPRFSPGEYMIDEILTRREADAVMLVAVDPVADCGPSALAQLSTLPLITVGSQPIHPAGAAVAFATSTYGIHTPGTVYRSDGVPLPLRPSLTSSLPSDFEVLSAIEKRVRELKATQPR